MGDRPTEDERQNRDDDGWWDNVELLGPGKSAETIHNEERAQSEGAWLEVYFNPGGYGVVTLVCDQSLLQPLNNRGSRSRFYTQEMHDLCRRWIAVCPDEFGPATLGEGGQEANSSEPVSEDDDQSYRDPYRPTYVSATLRGHDSHSEVIPEDPSDTRSPQERREQRKRARVLAKCTQDQAADWCTIDAELHDYTAPYSLHLRFPNGDDSPTTCVFSVPWRSDPISWPHTPAHPKPGQR